MMVITSIDFEIKPKLILDVSGVFLTRLLVNGVKFVQLF